MRRGKMAAVPDDPAIELHAPLLSRSRASSATQSGEAPPGRRTGPTRHIVSAGVDSDEERERLLHRLQPGVTASDRTAVVVDELNGVGSAASQDVTSPSSANEAPHEAVNPAMKARAALRRAARKVVLAQRTVKPFSSKGVPLLQKRSIATVFRKTMLQEQGAGALGDDAVPGEQTMELAARFVRDALANRSPNTRLAAAAGLSGVASTAASHASSRAAAALAVRIERVLFSGVYRMLFQLVVIAHCLMAAWEYIPPSISSAAFSWVPGVIEFAFLGFYTLDQAAMVYTFGYRYYFDKRWEMVFAGNLALGWLDWVLFYPCGLHHFFRIARPFRPLFGITKRKSLRRLLTSILRTIPKMVYISGVLFIVIMFYGTLGQQLFNAEQVPGYGENNDNFDSWGDAALAMFVLTTTENYPNVANEAYHHRPVVGGLFFVSALFIMLWLICPLILAIVYDHYLSIHKSMVQAKRVKQYLSLVFAYQTLMGGDGDREMNRETFIGLVRTVRPMQEQRASLMFDILDVDDSNMITIAEFLRLPTVLRVHVEPVALPDEVVPTGSRCSWPSLKYAFSRVCRRAVAAPWFLWLSVAVVLAACACGSAWTLQFQKQYDDCMCITMTLPPLDDNSPHDDVPNLGGGQAASAVGGVRWGATRMLAELGEYTSSAAWTASASPTRSNDAGSGSDTMRPTLVAALECVPNPGVCAWNPIRWTNYLGLLMLLLQGCELTMRSAAFVPTAKGFFNSTSWLMSSSWNLMDAFVVVWGTISYIALVAGAHESLPLSAADWFEIGRALSYLRLISLIPELRRIMHVVGTIISLVLRFVGVYLAITYAFAIVGMAIFGGNYQSLNNGFCQNCQMYTYETFPLAWVALLQLTVGNNWNTILYPNLQGAGSKWGAWYFMLYRFFMTDIFMNVIEGVMIETYTRQEAEHDREAEEAKLAAIRPPENTPKIPPPPPPRNGVNSTSSTGGGGGGGGGGGSGPDTISRSTSGANTSGGESPAPPRGQHVAVRWKRELFDDISAEENGELLRSPPMTGRTEGSSGVEGARSPRPSGLQLSARRPTVFGVTAEEISLLEKAIRKQEAALSRQTSIRESLTNDATVPPPDDSDAYTAIN